MADTEGVIDELNEQVAEVADDTNRWSQEESAEIFEGVAETCSQRARTIREEMEELADADVE